MPFSPSLPKAILAAAIVGRSWENLPSRAKREGLARVSTRCFDNFSAVHHDGKREGLIFVEEVPFGVRLRRERKMPSFG